MMNIRKHKSEPQNWTKTPQIKDWDKNQGSPGLNLVAFFVGTLGILKKLAFYPKCPGHCQCLPNKLDVLCGKYLLPTCHDRQEA